MKPSSTYFRSEEPAHPSRQYILLYRRGVERSICFFVLRRKAVVACVQLSVVGGERGDGGLTRVFSPYSEVFAWVSLCSPATFPEST